MVSARSCFATNNVREICRLLTEKELCTGVWESLPAVPVDEISSSAKYTAKPVCGIIVQYQWPPTLSISVYGVWKANAKNNGFYEYFFKLVLIQWLILHQTMDLTLV